MAKTAFEKSAGFAKFKDLTKRLVAVPKAELQEQIALHDNESKASGSRPGPKPTVKKRVGTRKKAG